jgi:hypothetical protein
MTGGLDCLVNGGDSREGLPPSNYVVKLVSSPSAPPVPITEPTLRPVSHMSSMSNVSGAPGVQTSRLGMFGPGLAWKPRLGLGFGGLGLVIFRAGPSQKAWARLRLGLA